MTWNFFLSIFSTHKLCLSHVLADCKFLPCLNKPLPLLSLSSSGAESRSAPQTCCVQQPAVLLFISAACYRLQKSSFRTDVGTTFVVERQHLHALCSLSTPTSAEGGVEEKGGGKASCQIRCETEAAEVVAEAQTWLGGFYTSNHDFLCCNLSRNMTCFFSLHLWFGQLTNIISS